MAAGEIDIFGKLVARTASGKICNAEQVDGLLDVIANAIQPEEKEIVNVLTYAADPPESPEDGDMFIDSDDNGLYVFAADEEDENGGTWDLETPSVGAIYVTADTSHMYLWNGTEFVDATGEVVDNTVYVNNLTTDLEEVTDRGIYTVCCKSGSLESWYTLIVSIARRMARPAIIVTTTQTLTAQNGWWQRSKIGSGNWSDWVGHEYIYQEQYNELYDLAAAGIVL